MLAEFSAAPVIPRVIRDLWQCRAWSLNTSKIHPTASRKKWQGSGKGSENRQTAQEGRLSSNAEEEQRYTKEEQG